MIPLLLLKDQAQLEIMLEIVNKFYNLNDIKINKDKSELLLKKLDKLFNYSNNLMIKFGAEYINIKLKYSNDGLMLMMIKSLFFNKLNQKLKNWSIMLDIKGLQTNNCNMYSMLLLSL
ncbi:hypothetical protein RhiirA4_480410 [Rhizophagus irregularis]|uniref:Reverse transcriptase domain-containing protein n=1 Tax=Rhizophagus irregularis TaxID=588596 RepID=A0A2I1HHW8_9GLOM|nr:hypothetical protein RhiirA4_480410 [Rhizophagus irregularis]